MNTNNFQNLIRTVTGRQLTINTEDTNLMYEEEYYIYLILPISKMKISFKWKTPKADEKMLRSFITAFTSKYREPNPEAYNHTYGGKVYKWEEKTAEQKEFAYHNHVSNMLRKEQLLKQIEENFNKESIANDLIKYGFYSTEYGVGIFCFWMTSAVNKSITAMKEYLQNKSIPFANEFSDAKWVYRFKLGMSKDIHDSLLQQFN